MKANYLILLLFITSCCLAQTDGQNSAYAPLETIITDLNADNVPDTLQIYLPPAGGYRSTIKTAGADNAPDTLHKNVPAEAQVKGQFTKITITLGGNGRNTFTANDAWDKIARGFLAGNKNAVTSNRVFVHKEADRSIILLFGFPYGSGPEEYAIILVNGNKMEFLHHYRVEDPVTFTDLDNDGHAELLCRKEPQMDTKTTGVYSPYMVYTFNGLFTLSQALTKKYNTEHYVWAGYTYKKDIHVEYPSDGSKPKIIN